MIDSVSQESDAWNWRPGITAVVERLPWAKLGLLVLSWLAIKLTLMHIYAHNSHAENYVRIRENIGRLKPRLWPALLNICGYLLPIVLLLRKDIRPRRFQQYLWIVPVWLGVMFYTGVILETRIYGELCPYVAIAMVLIIERHVSLATSALAGPAPARRLA